MLLSDEQIAAPVVQPAPEGMVMVPREPSIAMREALQVGTGASFLETRAVYLRLIAAAEKEAGK